MVDRDALTDPETGDVRDIGQTNHLTRRGGSTPLRRGEEDTMELLEGMHELRTLVSLVGWPVLAAVGLSYLLAASTALRRG